MKRKGFIVNWFNETMIKREFIALFVLLILISTVSAQPLSQSSDLTIEPVQPSQEVSKTSPIIDEILGLKTSIHLNPLGEPMKLASWGIDHRWSLLAKLYFTGGTLLPPQIGIGYERKDGLVLRLTASSMGLFGNTGVSSNINWRSSLALLWG